jgi:hypothetical protein
MAVHGRSGVAAKTPLLRSTGSVLSLCSRLALAISVALVLLSGPQAFARLLFEDDFSSGNFSRHNDFFRWGRSGEIPSSTTWSSWIESLVGPDGRQTNAIRFTYGTWQEVRFHLTRSVDERRGDNVPSDTIYPEIWVSYWMRVPANYFHRGLTVGNNNKGWLMLWKDRYANHGSSIPEDEITPTMNSFHWWNAGGTDQSHPEYGVSTLRIVNSRDNSSLGQRGSATFVRPRERRPNGHAYAFLQDEYGIWVHYAFGMKVASSRSAADGFTRVYKNGDLAIAWEGEIGGSDRPEKNGYDRGYIMGYHNSGYDEPTTFYITNWRIGTSRESVMGGGSIAKALPAAPVLSVE